MASGRNVKYLVVGLLFSSLEAVEIAVRAEDGDWTVAMPRILQDNREFVFAGVLVDRNTTPETPREHKLVREFLVIGYDLATRRTTKHLVLATSRAQAISTVGGRFPHPHHHVICGAYSERDVTLLCTSTGFLDLNYPAARITASLLDDIGDGPAARQGDTAAAQYHA